MPLKVFLNYFEKEEAKKRGLFWDEKHRTWFIPDNQDINLFKEWVDCDKYSIIAKAPFWVAVVKSHCSECNSDVNIIAFASNRFWLYDREQKKESRAWFRQRYFSFFGFPDFIAPEVLNIVRAKFTSYLYTYSDAVGGMRWTNHCQKCDAVQDELDIFTAPNGLFYPTNFNACKAITLITVPYKFDLMLSAYCTPLLNEKVTFKYLERGNW